MRLGPPLRKRPALRQWAWFVGLWAAGVLSLAVVAFGLRLLFHPGAHP